jgi:TolA-binding protein
LQLKRHDDAARVLMDVVRSYPTVLLTDQAYLWLGEHFFQKGDWGTAEQVFQALMKANPKTQHVELARLRIGQCSLNTNRLDVARAGFQSLLTDFPKGYYDADAEYGLGLCSAKEGKYDDALQHLSKVLEQDEGETAARAQVEMGNIYATKNDLEAANRAYLRVALLYDHPELTPEALFKAAQCLEKMNKPTDATKFYKELVEKYPNSSYAAQAKQKVSSAGGG